MRQIQAKDTTYTILSQFTYGESVINDNYQQLWVNKTLQLGDVNGNKGFDVGTKLIFVEGSTGHAYYYEVTAANAASTLDGISYTDFVDEAGNHYTNRKMSYFNDNGLVKYDEEGEAYATEQFITEAERIEVTAIPGLEIKFNNKINAEDGSTDRTYISGELSSEIKNSITIDAQTAIVAPIDESTGIAYYWQYITSGSTNVIDSSNNGKYIEIAIYLQDENSTQRISLPVGTTATIYDEDNPGGKKVNLDYGQSVIYYYKNSNDSYALDSITGDTYKNHRVVLDFSQTDLKDYSDSNCEIYMELIRTADSNYPMSSDRQDEYAKTVATAQSKDLAVALEVTDLFALGINTYNQVSSTCEIPFISKIDFNDVIDFTKGNANTLINTYSEKN